MGRYLEWLLPGQSRAVVAELRNFLESQENTHMSRNAERHAALIARVEQLENTLAAHVGQLEDRLDRRAPVAVVPTTPVAPTVITPPAPRF